MAEEEYKGWRVVEGPGSKAGEIEELPSELESPSAVGPALGEIPDHTGPNAIAGIELLKPEEEE